MVYQFWHWWFRKKQRKDIHTQAYGLHCQWLIVCFCSEPFNALQLFVYFSHPLTSASFSLFIIIISLALPFIHLAPIFWRKSFNMQSIQHCLRNVYTFLKKSLFTLLQLYPLLHSSSCNPFYTIAIVFLLASWINLMTI